MVEVKAFRGVHYEVGKVGDADKVVAPPHDVISETDQDFYYKKSPHNIVRIILGKEHKGDDESENKYSRARGYLDKWLSEGVLTKDNEDGLYVLEQSFTLDNGVERKLRGLIARVKIEPWERKVILPHEEIHPKAMEDRLMLTRACEGNMTFIMSIYSDTEGKTTDIIEGECVTPALLEAENGDGVINRIWAIHDEAKIRKLESLLSDRKLFIADGHHRYTNALTYSRSEGKDCEGAQYMMMLLLNMDDPNLTILAAQRVLRGIEDFDCKKYLSEIKEYFDVKEFPLSDKEEFYEAVDAGRMHAFGLYFGGDVLYLAKLKDDDLVEKLVSDNHSRAWKEIDAALLHHYLIDGVLGVDTQKIRDEGCICFVKDRDEALALVEEEKYQMCFILNPTRVEQVKAVAENGERMPQKATYFYPKPLSGLLLNKFE